MSIGLPHLVEALVPAVLGAIATAFGFGLIGAKSPATGGRSRLVRHLKWLGPLLILQGAFLGVRGFVQSNRPVSASDLAQAISEKLSLPRKVDEATTLVSVNGFGETIFYEYVVDAPLENRREAEQLIKAHALQQSCEVESGRKLLSYGYSVEMKYRFRNAEEVKVTVNEAICRKRS